MRVVEGSGDAAYDEAALEMIRRSDPVPQPPPMEADEGLNFTLDVIFAQGQELNERDGHSMSASLRAGRGRQRIRRRRSQLFFTSGQTLFSSGIKASSAGMVAISL